MVFILGSSIITLGSKKLLLSYLSKRVKKRDLRVERDYCLKWGTIFLKATTSAQTYGMPCFPISFSFCIDLNVRRCPSSVVNENMRGNNWMSWKYLGFGQQRWGEIVCRISSCLKNLVRSQLSMGKSLKEMNFVLILFILQTKCQRSCFVGLESILHG